MQYGFVEILQLIGSLGLFLFGMKVMSDALLKLAHTAERVLAEFLSLVRGEGSAALVATHNERLASKMNRVVRLHDGMLT